MYRKWLLRKWIQISIAPSIYLKCHVSQSIKHFWKQSLKFKNPMISYWYLWRSMDGGYMDKWIVDSGNMDTAIWYISDYKIRYHRYNLGCTQTITQAAGHQNVIYTSQMWRLESGWRAERPCTPRPRILLQCCRAAVSWSCRHAAPTLLMHEEIQLMYWRKKARVSGWDKSMELFIVFVGSVENIVSVYGPGWHTRRVAVAYLISFTHWQHERCSLLLQHLLPHYLQSKHLRKSKYDTSPLNVQFK